MKTKNKKTKTMRRLALAAALLLITTGCGRSSAPPASPLSERRWGAAAFCVFSEILTQHFFGAFTGASSLYFSVFPSVSLDFCALVSQIPFRFCFCALLLFFGSYAIIQIV